MIHSSNKLVREGGLEPPRPKLVTEFQARHVCQFHHSRKDGGAGEIRTLDAARTAFTLYKRGGLNHSPTAPSLLSPYGEPIYFTVGFPKADKNGGSHYYADRPNGAATIYGERFKHEGREEEIRQGAQAVPEHTGGCNNRT